MSNPYVTPRAMFSGLFSVALGGFLGSLLRGWLTHSSLHSSRQNLTHVSLWHVIPWSLLTINAVGVYLAVLFLNRMFANQSYLDPTRLFIVTGFLGGLTSYSGLFLSLYAVWQINPWASYLVGLGAIVSGVLAGAVAIGPSGRRS